MIFFLILIVVASVALGLFILIQNPKGGGLAGNIAGFSTQFMGVKQTTDVLEKGTWVLAILIALLSLCSSVFIPKSATSNSSGTTAPPPAAHSATPPASTIPSNSVPLNGGAQQPAPANPSH